MNKQESSEHETLRINIAERWTVDELAKSILNVREIYNLNIVVNSIDEKLNGSINLSKLSDYIYPDEELRVHRFEYASPGFVEVIGEYLPLISFAMIIQVVNLCIKFMEMKTNRDRLKLEKEKAQKKEERDELEKKIVDCEYGIALIEEQQHELQNNSEIIQKCKKLGMPELEIRELKNWIAQRINNIKDMVRTGKIISANIMRPDNMVKISAGKFFYGDENEEINIDYDYFIDVFPITNEQYEKFIEQGGYQNNDYWSEDGNSWRRKVKITEPKYWDKRKFNESEYPVVGVSYYEAEAYANWAGKRLPTEEEWERAARGTDGRVYPWGNEFDKEKCNSAESRIGRPTLVSQYPNGISPEGCYDMAGNVWEWVSSFYNKEDEGTTREIRGGSWDSDAPLCRSAARSYSRAPAYRNIGIGFRLARSVALGP